MQKTWQLPDESKLELHYRQQPINQVTSLNSRNSKVQLEKILVNSTLGNGQKIPITYQWSGSGEQLEDGIIILTWFSPDNSEHKWIHDHGFAMGNIHQGKKLYQ